MISVDPPAPVTVIAVTGMTWLLIVITSVPNIPLPSLAVALAVTVPFDTAVTKPVALIVAWPVPLAIRPRHRLVRGIRRNYRCT